MKENRLAKLAIAGIMSGGLVFTATASGSSNDDMPKKAEAKDAKYKGVHNCSGKNICKGLGGCSVSEAKLKKLAKKAGVPLKKAGKAHKCAGLNECKGLGGCKVTKEKLAKLKAKKAKKAKEKSSCKGKGGCKGANSCG